MQTELLHSSIDLTSWNIWAIDTNECLVKLEMVYDALGFTMVDGLPMVFSFYYGLDTDQISSKTL